MDQVRIYTLGRFAVEVGGRPVPDDNGRWGGSRAGRLLKILVTRPLPRRRLLRDQAIDLLWRDFSAEQSTLRGAVKNLRDALIAVGGEPMGELILTDRRDYTISLLHDAPLWVDADAFDELVRQARRDAEPLPLLREANALYAGEYLPDDIYEDWSAARREELKQSWVELQLLLARHAEQRHALDEAADALRRVLANDSCDERAAQELVRLLLRRGQPGDARRVYERLIQALRDLGIDPAPGILKLERELSADRPEHLPTGTVTYLLTDVEGSLRLWDENVDAMRVALARHDELLSAGIMEHGGAVIKMRNEGDSFFAVFSRASDAVAAAYSIQRALMAESWVTPTPLRVRMALNTGEDEVRDSDYYGPAVSRCARLRAAAHGGQILLAQATYDLVHDALPADGELIDLGEHQLRDFSHPERVYQLAGTGLPKAFPSLRGADGRLVAAPGAPTLPAVSSPLIGREQELRTLSDHLLRDDVRLLTLTGPPGTGKTRLGLQLASDLRDRFADGACFAALAPLSSPDLVAPTIGHALGLQEGGNRPLVEILTDYLRDKQLLLVLDNFEHLLAAAVLVAELLQASPRLKVLVTSRSPLHLLAEHEFLVPPLELPDPRALPSVDALAGCSAIALFAQRAAAIKPAFALNEENAAPIAEICHRLDGLPLAIELAAARSKLLPPQAMLARLGRRLPLLIGGARDLPARQQTLRGAITWSHDLLDETEQRLFRRLSTFVGGWTVPAAEVMCDAHADLSINVLDGVASLLDKSLVRHEPFTDPEPRFGILETIREYGLDQLEASGEGPEMRDRHLDYYLALAEEADAGLLGPQQVAWCNRLEVEHDNIRAAFEWVLAALETNVGPTSGLARAPSRLGAGIRLADALELFWMLRGHVRENWPRLTELVAQVPERTAARAAILVVAGSAAHCLLELNSAIQLGDEAVAVWRELDDSRGLASALARRGVYAVSQRDYVRAEAWLTEARSLFQRSGGEQRSGIEHPVVAFLAQAVHNQGDHQRAYGLYEEALAEAHARGDRHAVAYVLRHLGRLHLGDGQAEQAVQCLRGGLPALLELKDRRCTPPTLEALAYGLGRRDQWAEATRLFAAADALRETTGMRLIRTDRAHQESERTLLELRLGHDPFNAAWAEGQAMDLEQAIRYGLDASSDVATSVQPQPAIALDQASVRRSSARRSRPVSRGDQADRSTRSP
jgi:predicted ATPase/class 3 adenylate cyclase